MNNHPNNENLELGIILREIRLQLNLTQSQVSSATGLHINTISNIERGLSFRIDNFIIIARYYNLKPSEILPLVDL
jgi:transcriptional regulator with XRE-family HTH domain